jgi:hypothetical protein
VCDHDHEGGPTCPSCTGPAQVTSIVIASAIEVGDSVVSFDSELPTMQLRTRSTPSSQPGATSCQTRSPTCTGPLCWGNSRFLHNCAFRCGGRKCRCTPHERRDEAAGRVQRGGRPRAPGPSPSWGKAGAHKCGVTRRLRCGFPQRAMHSRLQASARSPARRDGLKDEAGREGAQRRTASSRRL